MSWVFYVFFNEKILLIFKVERFFKRRAGTVIVKEFIFFFKLLLTDKFIDVKLIGKNRIISNNYSVLNREILLNIKSHYIQPNYK